MSLLQNEKLRWTNIRDRIDQSYQYDDVWNEAIAVFDSRLKSKFFNPIQTIINKREIDGAGFSIVFVQCALIETFAAFRIGKNFSDDRNSNTPHYEYFKGASIFKDFLRTANIFKDHFWKINSKNKISTDIPYASADFYISVRCGLMHEARTKGNWLIRATPKTISAKTDPLFIVSENGNYIIYRTVLHYRLLHYLETYKDELRQDSQVAALLRRNFARKLDHLFDFPADISYEWWR